MASSVLLLLLTLSSTQTSIAPVAPIAPVVPGKAESNIATPTDANAVRWSYAGRGKVLVVILAAGAAGVAAAYLRRGASRG